MRYREGMVSHPVVTTTPTLDTPGVAAGLLERTVGAWLVAQQSPNTRAAYARDLRAFASWLTENAGVGLLEVRRPHVDAWRAWCTEVAELRPTTVARRLASLASFYAHAVTLGVLDASPTSGVKRPRTGEAHVELTPALDRAELVSLLEVATDPKDRALVLVLGVQGLRVSEALGLELDGIEVVRGHCTVLVEGKGRTEHRVPLPPVVCDAVRAVGEAEGRSTGPVFVGANGARMTRHGATRVLDRLARRAGLGKDVSPHMLRATAITGALDAGVSLRDVQDFARHADPRTTRRYDRARHNLDRHASYALAGWLGAAS